MALHFTKWDQYYTIIAKYQPTFYQLDKVCWMFVILYQQILSDSKNLISLKLVIIIDKSAKWKSK